MKTTVLIAEHVIIGLQTFVWFLLLFFIFIGEVNTEGLFSAVSRECSLAAGLFALSIFVYPFGIIIDNIADYILKKQENRIKIRHLPDSSMSVKFLLAKLKDETLSHHFEYMRTRIRICRSTALNFFIIFSLLIIMFAWAGGKNQLQIRMLLFGIISSVLICLSAYLCWYLLTKSYLISIGRNYSLIESMEQTEKNSGISSV